MDKTFGDLLIAKEIEADTQKQTLAVRRKFNELLSNDYKNEKRYLQQAEGSAIRFPIVRLSFLLDGNLACTRTGCRFVSR